MAGQVRGTDTSILLFEETVYSVEPGTPAGTKLYYNTFGVQKTQTLTQSNVLGQGRQRLRPGRGKIQVGGPLTAEIAAENAGLVCKHLLGSVSTTGAGPYVHEITPGSLPIGLHVERDYGSVISGSGRFGKFTGIRIGSCGFVLPEEGACFMNLQLLGADVVEASATLDASPTDNGFTMFAGADWTLDEGGSALATATNVTFNVNNELDASVYGRAAARRGLPEGFVTITGSLSALFEDTTITAKAFAATESSLKGIMSRGDGLGSAGNESMELFVQQLEYAPTSPPIEGPNGVRQSFDFTGYLSGATDSMKITIKNPVATLP